MKKISLFVVGLFTFCNFVSAQDIALPAPVKDGGKPLMTALNERTKISLTCYGPPMDSIERIRELFPHHKTDRKLIYTSHCLPESISMMPRLTNWNYAKRKCPRQASDNPRWRMLPRLPWFMLPMWIKHLTKKLATSTPVFWYKTSTYIVHPPDWGALHEAHSKAHSCMPTWS